MVSRELPLRVINIISSILLDSRADVRVVEDFAAGVEECHSDPQPGPAIFSQGTEIPDVDAFDDTSGPAASA